MQKTELAEMTLQFVQDGNPAIPIAEVLNVSFQKQIPSKPAFMVVKTSTGWSIDDIGELINLLMKAHSAYTKIEQQIQEQTAQEDQGC